MLEISDRYNAIYVYVPQTIKIKSSLLIFKAITKLRSDKFLTIFVYSAVIYGDEEEYYGGQTHAHTHTLQGLISNHISSQSQ